MKIGSPIPSRDSRRRGSRGCKQDPCSMGSHKLRQRHTEMQNIRFLDLRSVKVVGEFDPHKHIFDIS